MSQAWRDRCLVVILVLGFILVFHAAADTWDTGNRLRKMDQVIQTSEQIADAALEENRINQELEKRIEALEKKNEK